VPREREEAGQALAGKEAGRPEGGEAQAARAIFAAIEKRVSG